MNNSTWPDVELLAQSSTKLLADVTGRIHVRQLKDTGYNPRQLLDAALALRQMKDTGVILRQLEKVGSNPRQLKDAGLILRWLKNQDSLRSR